MVGVYIYNHTPVATPSLYLSHAGVSRVLYDDVNGELLVADGAQLYIYDYQTLTLKQTVIVSSTIDDIHVIYSQ